MDNICVSDVYVNVRIFRKFFGVCDVKIDYANNSVRVLSVFQRFFLYICIGPYTNLWGSKTGVPLGGYLQKTPIGEKVAGEWV